MIYESFDDDMKIRKLLRSLLLTKYRTENQDYDQETDNDADIKMNSVINLLNTANSDLYNIVFTINDRMPKIEVEKPDTQSSPDIASDPVSNPVIEPIIDPVIEPMSGPSDIDYTVTELSDIQLLNDSIAKIKGDIVVIEEKIADKTKTLEETKKELLKLSNKKQLTATDAEKQRKLKNLKSNTTSAITRLNKSLEEKKILLQENINELNKLVDKTPQDIGSESAIEDTEEDEDMTGSGPKSKPKKAVTYQRIPNYRSVNLYVNFTQYVLNLNKNLNKINQIFRDGLILHYDYVEPKTMQIYNKAYDKKKKMFKNFMTLTYDITEGVFRVLLKGVAYNQVEKSQLIDKVQSFISELDILYEYNETIRLNYNYRHTNMASKRNNVQSSSVVSPSLYEES